VVGEIALVNDIAHPIEKPIAGHADQPSSPPARAIQLSAPGRALVAEEDDPVAGDLGLREAEVDL
jgi:hypothetical protein